MERPVPQRETQGDAAKRRTLSPDDNPLVRAVGRVPARSTPSCSSRSWHGVAGRRRGRAGAPPARAVERAGRDARRAPGTRFRVQQASQRADHVRLLSARMSQETSRRSVTGFASQSRDRALAVDKVVANEVADDPAATRPDRLVFVPPPEDELVPRRDPRDQRSLSAVMQKIIAAGRAGRRCRERFTAVTARRRPAVASSARQQARERDDGED